MQLINFYNINIPGRKSFLTGSSLNMAFLRSWRSGSHSSGCLTTKWSFKLSKLSSCWAHSQQTASSILPACRSFSSRVRQQTFSGNSRVLSKLWSKTTSVELFSLNFVAKSVKHLIINFCLDSVKPILQKYNNKTKPCCRKNIDSLKVVKLQ